MQTTDKDRGDINCVIIIIIIILSFEVLERQTQILLKSIVMNILNEDADYGISID